jgi:hypothetical protein
MREGSGPTETSGMDRARLLLMFTIVSNPSLSEIQSYITALTETFPGLTLDFISEIWTRNNPNKQSAPSEEPNEEPQGFFSGVGSTLKQGGKSFLSAAKSYIRSSNFNGVIAKSIESYFQTGGLGQEFREDCYHDCLESKDLAEVKLDISTVVVYVAGGGSFYEYETIMSLRETIEKEVIYGCDYLYKP